MIYTTRIRKLGGNFIVASSKKSMEQAILNGARRLGIARRFDHVATKGPYVYGPQLQLGYYDKKIQSTHLSEMLIVQTN